MRSPKCLKMNDQVEDARRQLAQLQQQRDGDRRRRRQQRRQAELQDALARNGCGGGRPCAAAARSGGGLFDWFGGGQEEEEAAAARDPDLSQHRSRMGAIVRSACGSATDSSIPISIPTYSSRLAQDAEQCQSSCAAPAELYVYRNPGQEIEQAISLNGSAYMDLPVALKYRKSYVNGCSCKQAEYNPTEIEAANKRAEAEAATQPAKGKGKAKVAAKPAPAPATAAATPAQTGAQSNLDVTGSNQPAAAAAPPPQAPPRAPGTEAAGARRRDCGSTSARTVTGRCRGLERRQEGRQAGLASPAVTPSSNLAVEPRHGARPADQRQQLLELGPVLAPRQRKPQRLKQRLALGAGRLLHLGRPPLPGRAVPRLGRQENRSFGA